jgi:hypothetical protein
LEKTTNLPQVTDKLYLMMLYRVHLAMNRVWTHNSAEFLYMGDRWVENYQVRGPSWSYGSWIYNDLCNQCLSPLKLWVQTLFMARCTRYSISPSSRQCHVSKSLKIKSSHFKTNSHHHLFQYIVDKFHHYLFSLFSYCL